MKTIILLVLFSSSLYGADIYTTNKVGDLTTVVGKRVADNGKPLLGFETVYRGKTKILTTLSGPDKNGKLAVTERIYYVDGDTVMTEIDVARDGRFAQVSLYHPGTDNIEIFTRGTDGSVKPLSTERLTAFKEHTAADKKIMAESFQKMMDNTNMTDEEIGKMFQDTRQKIQNVWDDKKTETK